jgi:hypothetical protein
MELGKGREQLIALASLKEWATMLALVIELVKLLLQELPYSTTTFQIS